MTIACGMRRAIYITTIVHFQAMTAGYITFFNVSLRNTVVTEQYLIIFLLKKWLDAFSQSMQVNRLIIKRRNDGKPEFVFFLCVNFFGIFHRGFIARHGIMR